LTSKNNLPHDNAGLRQFSETIAHGKATQPHEDMEPCPPGETKQMLHELRAQQVELEMQDQVLKQTLLESEKKYRDLFELSPVGIFKTHSKGHTLLVNPQMAKIMGAESNQDAIEKFKDLGNDLYADSHRRETFINLIKARGAVNNWEYEAKSLDGKRLWLVENAKVSETYPDGTFIIDGFATDITERKRTEKALRESENKYRLIAENTADRISIMDMNLDVTHISPAVMRLRGFTVEEAMGQTLDQVLTPESMQLALTVFEEELRLEDSAAADPGRTRTLELEAYKKDGSTVWMEVSLSFLRGKDKKPYQIIAVSRDIHQRKQADAALRNSESILNSVLETVPIPVFYKDKEGRYFRVNKAFETFLGKSRQQVVGKTASDISSPELAAVYHAMDVEVYEKTGIQTYETQIQDAYGVLRDVISCKTPFVDVHGATTGLVGAFVDITDRKQAEENLRQYERILSTTEDMLILLDKNFLYLSVNAAFLKALADSGQAGQGRATATRWNL
jgi:PAS domain S-box-containing protein